MFIWQDVNNKPNDQIVESGECIKRKVTNSVIEESLNSIVEGRLGADDNG